MLTSFRACLLIVFTAVLTNGCASAPTAPMALPAKLTKGCPDGFQRHDALHLRQGCEEQRKVSRNDECARNWLPFYAPAGARAGADYQIITRDDGKSQWAFKGKPLYFWPEDQEPGDKYGDGYNNLWRLITAKGPITVVPAGSADGY